MQISAPGIGSDAKFINRKEKQMKTTNKKTLCLVLSLALLLGSISGITLHANAAETVENIIVYVAAEGNNTSDVSVSIDKTPVILEAGSTATDAIRVVLDKTYKDHYTISSNEWGDSLDAIGDLAQTADYSAYWNFCVNGESASTGISSYVLEDQDQISLIYGGYPLPASECLCYQNDTSLAPDEAAQQTLLADAKAQQKLLAEKIYESNLQNGAYVPGIEDTGSLYLIFNLVQSGFQAEDYYTAVVNKILAQFTAIQTNGSTYGTLYDADITYDYLDTNPYAVSNYCKIALCLSALGVDITDVAGVNLVDKITNRNIYTAATKDNTLSRDTFILLTMDGTKALWPDTPDTITRTELVNILLKDVDAKIANCVSWNSYDYAAMIIQALAAYTDTDDPDIDTDALDAKCNQVIDLLSNIQSADGSYISYGSSNPWTLAQVMTTMGLYEINPLDDELFIKNGKTVFDVSATFVNTKEQWIDPQLIGGESAFQPEQLLAGLTSCIRSAEQANHLFDLTEASCTVTPMDTAAMQIINTTMVAPIADQTYTGNPVKPKMTVTAKQTTLVEETDYTVTYLNNINTGTAYAVITGKGDWMNTSIKVSFQIIPVSQKPNNTGGNQPPQTGGTVSNPPQGNTGNGQQAIKLTKPVIRKLTAGKKKTLTIRFSKVKQAKKYKIQIATDRKFRKNVKTKTVTSVKNVTFQKLKSGKKYYVRIRALNPYGNSKWSNIKSKKIK